MADGVALGGTSLPATWVPGVSRESEILAEIDLAGKVQELLLPKSSPTCDWCCTAIRHRTAAGLGGDFYDFMTMPDDCQALFVGDVTGHGLHASVVMSLIYGFLHRAAQQGCLPRQIVSDINDFLIDFGSRSTDLDYLFSTTLFFGIINPRTFRMSYVNAGHPPPLVRRGADLLSLPPTGQPLGFFAPLDITMETFAFAEGDRLLLYTDGITEGSDSAGLLYGEDRLRSLLLAHEGSDEDFVDLLFRELSLFGVDGHPADDCTAIVVDFNRRTQRP